MHTSISRFSESIESSTIRVNVGDPSGTWELRLVECLLHHRGVPVGQVWPAPAGRRRRPQDQPHLRRGGRAHAGLAAHQGGAAEEQPGSGGARHEGKRAVIRRCWFALRLIPLRTWLPWRELARESFWWSLAAGGGASTYIDFDESQAISVSTENTDSPPTHRIFDPSRPTQICPTKWMAGEGGGAVYFVLPGVFSCKRRAERLHSVGRPWWWRRRRRRWWRWSRLRE